MRNLGKTKESDITLKILNKIRDSKEKISLEESGS